MSVCIAANLERGPGESRVALVPETVKKFTGLGARVKLESGAGRASHFTDADYAGAEISARITDANVMLCVTPPSPEEIAQLPEGSILLGLLAPYASKERLAALNARRITAFALELLPRISRAQSMDVLSSQASCAGYQCGL
ncbi:MAG: hypothetical protein RIR00_2038, partial [Pseudomonadota bacterium]